MISEAQRDADRRRTATNRSIQIASERAALAAAGPDLSAEAVRLAATGVYSQSAARADLSPTERAALSLPAYHLDWDDSPQAAALWLSAGTVRLIERHMKGLRDMELARQKCAREAGWG